MEVFVTSRAEKNFDSIVNYIRQSFGENTAKQFIEKADDTFTLLKSYPLMGRIESGDIRGFQLSPQTRILYRIREQKLIILAFFDVRQEPGKKLS
ncbi:MAG: type II toxin-antitoxin system RelE/ParE family toxin [Bacteroidota bacterium]